MAALISLDFSALRVIHNTSLLSEIRSSNSLISKGAILSQQISPTRGSFHARTVLQNPIDSAARHYGPLAESTLHVSRFLTEMRRMT